MKEDKEYLAKILPELKAEMSCMWRVQSFSKRKPQATCVAYINARDAQDRLDEVCLYGWERDHREIKKHVYAGVGIVMPSGRVLWRWDCGTESNQDAEKGEASDSFKRAAVNWGIGRFLYDLKIQYVDANEIKKDGAWPYVVDGSKRVWDLTEFINNKNQKGGNTSKPQSKPPEPTFSQKMQSAKKAVGAKFFNDCLKAHSCECIADVKPKQQEEILSDLRKERDRIAESQNMR